MINLPLSLVLVGCVYYIVSRRIRRSRLPPGPPGIPIPFVGNMYDMPSESPWLTFLQWGREYNDRGLTTIFRVESTMVNKLMGWEFDLGFITYGDRWREERRMFSKEFSEKAIKQFRHSQVKAAHRFVQQLAANGEPSRLPHYIRHQIAAMSLDIGYGVDLAQDDPWLEAAHLANEGLATASVPGTFWIDSFPALKYLPSWFPGAGFKRQAKIWKEAADHMVNMPYERMKKLAPQGLARPSYASARLQAMDPNGDLEYQEQVIKNTASQVNVGGGDTTVSAVSAFILAMVIYPEVQRKVQAELDAVLSNGRIPDYDEENDSMPYLTACVKELFRWNQIAPLAIPHKLVKDDIYRGYLIPKNTLVFANSWAVLNDPEVYPDPSVFRPERYLGPDGKPNDTVRDPRKAAFGYGRRNCPGIHLALSTVWITAATLLSVFDIERPVDHKGNPIDIPAAFTKGFFRHPEPFQCRFVPRNEDSLKSLSGL
ncbi:Dimethyltryptamine 4-hydroxylase (PsiH) [Panaeolus cyanescens]|uniref:Dimethyltryptamine 4-hydroxylase (PsiH) n=1 Tax=Panaeolus cyanescens TaxID=181874 RepID=A0A409Y6T7_9AGAR|nr:Dimethyltryptamine 4-hydroxylase (PsiH) [Panaeolus cyanescens]